MKPPVPGRPYWIYQAAGWGGFLAYVLLGYVLTGVEHSESYRYMYEAYAYYAHGTPSPKDREPV